MSPNTSRDASDRLERVLATMGMRDRSLIEKRLATLDADADGARAVLWRRLLVKLSELVPLPPHPLGSHAVQFFIPDGKYKMQVFALEDVGDGSLVLYLPDLLARAVKSKVLVNVGGRYSPAEAPNQTLTIQQMDVNTFNPAEFMKHMVGWNRKAIKLTLQVSAHDSAQLTAAERLCELTAAQWNLPESRHNQTSSGLVAG